MNLDEMTIGQFKSLSRMLEQDSTDKGPWEIGQNYLIRTVTNYQTGRLVAVYPQELLLEDAAWIPDTGRFSESLSDGSLAEVEPIPGGKSIIGRGSIVDAELWCHELPKDKK